MKSLIVANWKMNPQSWRDAKKLFEETKKMAANVKGVSIVVAPPSIFLRDIAGISRGKKIALGAQNAHYESSGSFTGEISIPQARDAKASYLIVGHAERRAMGETNGEARAKVAAALSAGLVPILCVGEEDRGAGAEHLNIVKEQLHVGLADVPPAKLSKVVIAYEPVWAIGAAEAMKPRDMHEMSIFIRKMVVEKFGETGMNVAILYGGSVDASNAVSILTEGDVKGFILGRVSVDANAFAELLRAVSAA